MPMNWTYDAATKTMDEDTPLATRDMLLLICKEIDADTPEDETTAYIETAHVLLCSVLDGYGIPTSLMTQIEKYLAAHYAAIAYPVTQREGLGPLTRSYATKIDLRIDNTKYGQQAIALDPTNVLASLNDGKVKKEVVVYSVGNGIVQDPTLL